MSFLQLSTILVESWKILCDLWKLFSLLFSHNTNISTVWKYYTGFPFIWQKRTVFSSWVIHKRSNWKIFTLASFLGSWDIEGICSLLFVPKIWYQYWDYFSATRWHSLSLQRGQEYQHCVFYHTYWDQLRKNTKYCIFQNVFTKTAAEMSHLSFTHTCTCARACVRAQLLHDYLPSAETSSRSPGFLEEAILFLENSPWFQSRME